MNIIISILLILNLSLYCFAAENPEQEVGNFSLVQYKEGGDKKWTLNGKSAQVEENNVKIDEVSAVAFGEDTAIKLKAKDGNFEKEEQVMHLENNVVVKSTDGTTLTTDSLKWDAQTKNVFTDSAVRIKKSDFEVSGTGAVCNVEDKTAELKKDVTATMTTSVSDSSNSADGLLSVLKQGERHTTITCDGPLDINYKKYQATFLNNVKIEDVQGDIFADRIDVYFNQATRRIKSIVANGNVRIVNGENVTYSEKAVYLVEQGRLVLPQRPKLVIQSNTN